CRTQTKLVYTTATGVSTLPCSNCDTTLPADYDYYSYPFGYLTTSQGPTSTTDTFQEGTNHPFTVAEGTETHVTILIANYFITACYDGTVALGATRPPGTLSPFGWGPRVRTITDYFPSGTPAFGLAYIPLFLSVSDGATAAPVGETYVASGVQ